MLSYELKSIDYEISAKGQNVTVTSSFLFRQPPVWHHQQVSLLPVLMSKDNVERRKLGQS
jgi:hypothetical protein